MSEPRTDDIVYEELNGKVKVLKLNIDENQRTPSRYNVRAIPTLMIFKDGQLTATQSPSYVITKTKVSATKQMESREYFDGWARSVLRVAPALNAPTTQRTDAATFYDDRGLVEADVPAFSRSAQGVSAGALSFDPMGTPLPTHTNYTYDAAGRPVTVARQEANPDGTAVDAVTTSTYDGRVTTTNLPSPLGETKTTVDGSGRTVALVATGPTADGSREPMVPVTFGRGGRLARQVAGIRTMTPALSRSRAQRMFAASSKRALSSTTAVTDLPISPASLRRRTMGLSWLVR